MRNLLLISLLAAAYNASASDNEQIKSKATVLNVCKFNTEQTPVLNFGNVQADVSSGGDVTADVTFYCTKGLTPVFKLRPKSVTDVNPGINYNLGAQGHAMMYHEDQISKLYYTAKMVSFTNGIHNTAGGKLRLLASFNGIQSAQSQVRAGTYSDELLIVLTP
jgi:spore coat protein U-like protein